MKYFEFCILTVVEFVAIPWTLIVVDGTVKEARGWNFWYARLAVQYRIPDSLRLRSPFLANAELLLVSLLEWRCLSRTCLAALTISSAWRSIFVWLIDLARSKIDPRQQAQICSSLLYLIQCAASICFLLCSDGFEVSARQAVVSTS